VMSLVAYRLAIATIRQRDAGREPVSLTRLSGTLT